MSGGKQPDYHLYALDKSNESKARVGAAWNGADGRISIKLDCFVVLQGSQDLVLSLFPNRPRKKDYAAEQAANKAEGRGPREIKDDEPAF